MSITLRYARPGEKDVSRGDRLARVNGHEYVVNADRTEKRIVWILSRRMPSGHLSWLTNEYGLDKIREAIASDAGARS